MHSRNYTYIEFIVELEHFFIQNICSYFLENILIWVQYLVTLNAGQEMKKSCYDDRRKFSFFSMSNHRLWSLGPGIYTYLVRLLIKQL